MISTMSMVLIGIRVIEGACSTGLLREGAEYMVDDIFGDAERRMQKAIEALKQDISAIRTGRANAVLLDRITVDYYGSPTPVNQVANISAPEARLLVIQPWDRK